MYKSEILKKIREQNPSAKYISDDVLLQDFAKNKPNISIEDDPWAFTKVGIWAMNTWKYVWTAIWDFSEAVVTWIDNVATDITNNTISKITWVKYKPLREQLVPTWEQYQGGLLQRSIDTTKEKWQIGAEALSEWWFKWAYQYGWANVGALTSVAWDVFMSWLKTLSPDSLESQVKTQAENIAQNTAMWRNIVDLLNEYQSNMDYLSKNDRDAYRTYQAHFSYLEWLAEVVWIKKVWWVFKAWDVNALKSMSKEQLTKLNTQLMDKATLWVEKVAEWLWNVKQSTFSETQSIFDRLPWVSKEYQKAISPEWVEFEVEQTPWFFQNVNDKVFQKSSEEMAVQSVFPKQTKEKWISARLNAWKIALNWIEQLYNDKARWIVKSDIREMGGWVEWIDEWLTYWGKKIWEYTNSDYTINLANEVEELKKVLDKQFSKLNPDMYNRVKNVVREFEMMPEVTINNLQEWISNIKSDVFSNFEITKQLASSSTGKALWKFLDELQTKFDTAIDIASGQSEELAKAKSSYSKYKKIQKDLVDSYIVSQRNAGKWLSKTAGQLTGAYEILQNPSLSWVVKWILLKQSWDLISKARSRDGNWEMLMRNLDRRAVENYKLNKNYDPKTENMAGNTRSNRTNNSSATDMSIDNSNVDNIQLKDKKEIVEFAWEVARQIEENMWNKEILEEIREMIKDADIPDRYKDFLDEKVNNYIKNVDDYQKEMDMSLSSEWNLTDVYWDDLVKAFNRLQGIQKRTKTTKGWDKMTSVEFQSSSAYKTFSDYAQEFINERWMDKSVQELFDEMTDFTDWNLPRFQTSGQTKRKTWINRYDDQVISDYLDKNYDRFPHLKKPSVEEYKATFENLQPNLQKNILKNLKEESEPKELIALHNLSKEKLQKIQDLWWMPWPSLAVTKAWIPFEEFWDITLVWSKWLITSPKAKTYSADIYSPRVPNPTIQIKDNALIKRISDETWIDEWKVQSDIEDWFYKRWEEYKDYIDEIDSAIEKKLYKWTTYMWKKKYADYTLENIVKDMFSNKNVQWSESSIFGWSLKQTMWKEAKSLTIPKMKKIDFAERSKYEDKYKELDEKWSNKFIEIADKSDSKSFFDVSNNIDYEFSLKRDTNSIVNSLNEYWINVDNKDIEELKMIVNEISDLPKDYLETKIQRAVLLDEFNYILVPENQFEEVKQILKWTDLENKIETYKDEWERTKLIQEIDDRYWDVRFQEQLRTSQLWKEITQENAKKIVNKYFDDKDVKVEFVENITTPEWLEALWMYKDSIITFSKNPDVSTPEHEVLHAYFDTMTSIKKQSEVLDLVKKEQKIDNNLDAEEWLADNFVEFVRWREVSGISDKLKQYFADMWENMKSLFGREDKINALYRDIENLKNKNKVNKTQATAVVTAWWLWEENDNEE